MRAPSDEHKVIWLEPSCGEENTEGRQWCQDNVWGDKCDGCEAQPVKFIRADLVENLIEIVEGLLANWPHTEVIDYYNPRQSRPVLTKAVALERAADIVRNLK